MTSVYNRCSGRSVDRIRGLVDGVFAVAMTLLVLDVKLPDRPAHNSHQLWSLLTQVGPNLAACLHKLHHARRLLDRSHPPASGPKPRPGLELVRRRLYFAQALYAAAALLVVLGRTVSIVTLAVVQPFFTVSPRLPFRA